MATKQQEVSTQTSNYISFTQQVSTSTSAEFLNGLNTSIGDFPPASASTVTTTFDIEGQNLILTCQSVVGYGVTAGTANGLQIALDGHAVTDILLDDTYVVKRHAWNKYNKIEIKNIPFSKVSIVSTGVISGANSIDTGSLTKTDGGATNQIGCIVLYS